MLYIVIALIGLALVFDFINGFHDSANSIATVVSTRVLSPGLAVGWAAFFNFIAAFGGTVKVANTMGKGVIQFDQLKAHGTTMVLVVIFAALLGAILWNLLTWWWGLPSSSSHALAGGLIGATLPALGLHGLVAEGIIKIAIFIVLSPLIGMVLGTSMMIGTAWLVRRRSPTQVDKWFRRLQLVSSGVFITKDGGKSWTPLRGPRASSWLGSDFTAINYGVLGGVCRRSARCARGRSPRPNSTA